MAQMLQAISDLFEEDYVPAVDDHLTKLDKNYSELIVSAEGVTQDNITRDYKVVHTFVTSLAGAVRPASALGPQMVGGLTTTEMIAAHDTYPGVADTPMPGLNQRELQIGKLKGSIIMNLAQLRAQQLHTIGDYPGIVLQQFAKHLAQNQCVAWYIDDAARVIRLNLGTTLAAALVTTHVVGTNIVTFVNATQLLFNDIDWTAAPGNICNGAIRRIMPGMQYDLWQNDGATLAADTMPVCYTTRGWVMVDTNMNMYNANTVTLYFQSTLDADAFAAAFPTGGGAVHDGEVWMTPYDAIPNKAAAAVAQGSINPIGYQSWMRGDAAAVAAAAPGANMLAANAGNIFGTVYGAGTATRAAITGTSHGSMFQTLWIDMAAASLTEFTLNMDLTYFEDATSVATDTLIMVPGVLVDLMESYGVDAAGVTFMNRDQSQPGKVNIGYDWLNYRYNGRMYQVGVSSYLKAGRCIAIKRDEGNLIRYEPPTVPGSQGGPPIFDGRIEWLAKALGESSIWMPATAPGGGVTDGLQAPFDRLFQHAAKEVRGVVWEDCAEN